MLPYVFFAALLLGIGGLVFRRNVILIREQGDHINWGALIVTSFGRWVIAAFVVLMLGAFYITYY